MRNQNEPMNDLEMSTFVRDELPYAFDSISKALDKHKIEHCHCQMWELPYFADIWQTLPDDVKQELYDIANNSKRWGNYCETTEKHGWVR